MTDFTWRDGDRVIRFGRGALADAPALLGDDYVLLTTERAADDAPAVVAGARAVHHVPAGPVDELVADLRGRVDGALLVALGGGRVVDVAKALAALSTPTGRAAAIPTTLSAAEMTSRHRLPPDAPPGTPRVRPAIVLNDPALSASLPARELLASAANALAHAVEGPVTIDASPVPTLVAHEATRRLAGGAAALDGDGLDDDAADELALGALLSGWVIDATGIGLHHVLAQTLVRAAGVGHGPANAAMLPHTAAALRRRAPEVLAALDAAAGRPIEALAMTLAAAAGARRLRELGVDEAALAACVEQADARDEVDRTPPRPSRDEIRALYEAAW